MSDMIRRFLSRFTMTPASDASSGAGGADMIPADLQARFSKALLGELREQKGHDVGNGLYETIIVSFVFNHERIEGNATSEVDTRTIFETRDIVLEDDSISNDVRETANHTLMFDYLIDTIDEPLDEALIRGLHRSLMQGVMKTPGEWKVNPNGVGSVSTVRPCDVPEAIDALLTSYGRHQATLDNITRFHVRYETIHPFADGNGRTGRAIMFRECLRSGLIPFIVTDETKDRYYSALDAFRRGDNSLLAYALDMQREFLRLTLPLLRDVGLAEELSRYVPGIELASPAALPDDYFVGDIIENATMIRVPLEGATHPEELPER